MCGKISSRGRVTIPKKVRERLGLEPGDDLAFDITLGNAIVIRRVDADDNAYQMAVFETPSEWDSDADNKAFGPL